MISKIKKLFISEEFVKFAIVGGINTFNHNIIYLLCLNLMDIDYRISNIIAFCISMVISFFLSCYFTFKIKPTWKKFITFPISNIPNLIMQTGGIAVIVGIIGVPEQFGAIVSTLVALPFTFLTMRFVLLFKKTK